MSQKPAPIPVMVTSKNFRSEARLHRKVNGKCIVELMTPTRSGTFVTVEPHEVESLTFARFLEARETVAA